MQMRMTLAFATHLAFGVPWSAFCVGERCVKGTLSSRNIKMGGFARIDMVLQFTPNLKCLRHKFSLGNPYVSKFSLGNPCVRI